MRHGILKNPRLLLVSLLTFVLTSSAQDFQKSPKQDFQIRTRVDLVVVPVTVKGAKDRSVAGLTQDDFLLIEDRKQQTISNFSVDPVPLSAAIVVDTGLTEMSFSKVKEAFPALVGAFSDADEVAVYRYDKYVTKILDFTGDKLVVEQSMQSFQAIEATELRVPSGPFELPGPTFNGGQMIVPNMTVGIWWYHKPHKVLHDAIFLAASELAAREQDRRKIVLIVSNGTSVSSEHSYDETLGRLLDTGIQVYAVGMDVALLGRETSVLEKYARDTGGDACYLATMDALETCYARSAEQARNQYVLGYISNNVADLRPVFREIQVHLIRGGPYETRHRKGYYQYP